MEVANNFPAFSLRPGDGVTYEGRPAVFVRAAANGRAAIIDTAAPGKSPRYMSVLLSDLKTPQR